jgi:Zn-dependent metalloprotease
MKLQTNLLYAAVLSALLVPTLALAGNSASLAARANGLINGSASRAVQRADADAFVAVSTTVDANGTEHVRFTRSYRGLRVIGGDFVVHSRNGVLQGVSQTLRTSARPGSVVPQIDRAHAIVEAGSRFGTGFVGTPRSRLVIYALGKARSAPVLAHEVTLVGRKADQTPTQMHYFIDARTGALLNKWDAIETAVPGPDPVCPGGIAANGTGRTITLGDVGIGTALCGSRYQMLDPTRGGGVTHNMAQRTSGLGVAFTDADNVWGNNQATDSATAGAEAHFGVSTTWDYYRNQHGRDGIADDGRGALSRVHYGRNYGNAFWNDGCFCMTFGDGNPATTYPLTVLDVAGHEMSHGVTSRTAGLVYADESGGLNEATSDIFGTMVEFYANNAFDPGDYIIGEEIFKANATLPPGSIPLAIRYMFKPSLDGNSPDCYQDDLGDFNVHYSSGVANHFFYLLAQGSVVPVGFRAGSQANLRPADLVCSGSSALHGIGRRAAERIWYRALTTYMTSDTTYAEARAATISAARDLYGRGSAQAAAVAAAWNAVLVHIGQ